MAGSSRRHTNSRTTNLLFFSRKQPSRLLPIGEVSNTFLTVRRQLPVKLATGTSALVLHLTILLALITNLVVLWIDPPSIAAKGLWIPWMIGMLLAPVVVVGGQVGSLLNTQLSDWRIVQAMIGA